MAQEALQKALLPLKNELQILLDRFQHTFKQKQSELLPFFQRMRDARQSPEQIMDGPNEIHMEPSVCCWNIKWPGCVEHVLKQILFKMRGAGEKGLTARSLRKRAELRSTGECRSDNRFECVGFVAESHWNITWLRSHVCFNKFTFIIMACLTGTDRSSTNFSKISIERTAAPPVSSRPCKHGIRELVGMTCVRSVAARLKLELSSPTTVDTLASRSPAASEAEALPDCPSSTGLQPTPATLFVKTVQSTSFNSFCSARTKPAPKAELQSSTSCGGSHPPAGLKTLKAVSLPLPLSATITGRSLSHSNRQNHIKQLFLVRGDYCNQSISLNSSTTKEQELLRDTFALFKEDSIPSLLDHLRASEGVITDENVGWFEDGFSEPFRPYFIPNRIVCLVIIPSTLSKKCETMLVNVLSHILLAWPYDIFPSEQTEYFYTFLCKFSSNPVGPRLMLKTMWEYHLKWYLMEFLVDSCQPSSDPSAPSQIVLTRPTPLLISAIDEMNTRFSIHDLSRYLSTPPDLSDETDKDSSVRTDLAFDVLFLSLLSIVSDEAFHKPARHLLARMFQISESELEKLLLEREVRRGDLEMEWLGEGRQKETTLSFAEGVWMLLGRRETEWERDEDTNEAATDEESAGETEDETESEETEQEPESVEYPRSLYNQPFQEVTSTPTVFLHRVACLLISALFSAECDCLSSNHQPIAPPSTTNNDPDATNDSVSEPTNRTRSMSHLFRICLKLTGWFQTTFEKWKSGSVFTKTVRMDVESAVSLVFLIIPHADLDSQCFLVFLLRHFHHFIEMEPLVVTPDLVRKVALFFARLGPSLPPQLVRSVEYGVGLMMAGKGPMEHGPFFEESAGLCRPILAELVGRLESDVEGRREVAAQIWVIVLSNDNHLLSSSNLLVHLLSVLSDETDDNEAFFILRACTKAFSDGCRHSTPVHSLLSKHFPLLLRLGKRISRLQLAVEAWRLLLQMLFEVTSPVRSQKEEMIQFLGTLEGFAVDYGETVGRVLQMRNRPNSTLQGDEDINQHLHFLGCGLKWFQKLFQHIDFSPLHLSLVPALTPLRPFFGSDEDSLWVRDSPTYLTLSSFRHLNPFHFIPTSPSFPTEQSVLDDILRSKIARAEWIIRYGEDVKQTDQSERDLINLQMSRQFPPTLQMKLALECAIRLPRLLYNSIPFHRARQAQLEQGEEKRWTNDLVYTAELLLSTFDLGLLTNPPNPIILSREVDVSFVSWAFLDGNRRDALTSQNEENSTPSDSCLSFFENLQFAAMWAMNGMVESPFSRPSRIYNRGLQVVWKLMLYSILFRPPIYLSMTQTAVQMRVCLREEELKVSASPMMSSDEYDPFLNWSPEHQIAADSFTRPFLSLVSIVRDGYSFDDELVRHASVFFVSLSLTVDSMDTANDFLKVIEQDSTGPGVMFVDSITVLLFSPHRSICRDTLTFVCQCLYLCYVSNILALVSAKLIPSIISTPHLRDLSRLFDKDILSNILTIFDHVIALASPNAIKNRLPYFGINTESVRDVVLGIHSVCRSIFGMLVIDIWPNTMMTSCN
ncbi:hypothetical protein BLNAU_5196 [Blattamonas nauphoetae]|uniref:Uncharacterized protein n=1 Tax=Blattamonas nauphoetae TaxID=2049346 RepID=A0ABQ9Y7K3_9EUKA|nr:hypothetical protein BLNAU_5196 [Blattamonas nauphoetae]